MLKDITLGQFYSVKSPIHELDPRVKIRFVLVYIILSLLDRNLYLFGLLSIVCLTAVFLSNVPIRHILKGLRGIILFILLCSLINSFTVYGEVLFSLGAFEVTVEGVLKSVYVFWRMLLIILMSALLMYTTTPTELTDGFEKCFALKGNVAMGITIALRFIPTLLDETERIMKAQASRGVDFNHGGVFKRFRSIISLIIPLFISALERSEELANAMIVRGYDPKAKRTRYRLLRFSWRDIIAFLFIGAIFAGIIVLFVFDRKEPVDIVNLIFGQIGGKGF